MDLGLDYSWGRPSLSTVVSQGYRFVIRYLSYDQTGKNITAAERDQILSAGLELMVHWQWRGGDSQWQEMRTDPRGIGRRHAQDAVAQARAIGYPTGCDLPFSVDFDPRPSGRLPVVLEYLRGASEVTRAAGYRMGVYGGYSTVKAALDAGIVDMAWQTYAWSDGQWDPRAVLRQVRNGVKVGGADTDINERHGKTFMMGRPSVSQAPPERVLSHLTHVQDNGYYCGPASVVTALSVRGISISEGTAAKLLGTTTFGTNSSNDIVRGLNHYVGAGVYAAVFVPSGGGASAYAAFKARLVSSVAGGYALVCNVVGSARAGDGRTYSYPGGHYVAVCGYRSNGDEALVTDVAVGRDYWMSTRTLIDWIAGRGYAYAQGVDDGVSPQEFADIVTTILTGATAAGYWDASKVSDPHLKNMAFHAVTKNVYTVEQRLNERIDKIAEKLDRLSTGGVDAGAVADAIKAQVIAAVKAEISDMLADAAEAAASQYRNR